MSESLLAGRTVDLRYVYNNNVVVHLEKTPISLGIKDSDQTGWMRVWMGGLVFTIH